MKLINPTEDQMARGRIAVLFVVIVVCFVIGAFAQGGPQPFCLLCQNGWCIRNYHEGGACICINHDGGQCQTVGVCWPTQGGGSTCTGVKSDMLGTIRDILERDPKAHIRIARNCKMGNKVMRQIHKEYEASGHPIMWSEIYN